jgi:hypothetical protein
LCPQSDAPFVLDVVLAQRGNRWHVTEVNRFAEYIGQNFELESNRLAKRDMLIADAMQDALVLEGLEMTTTPGGFGIGKSVLIEADLANRGEREIEEYTVELVCKSADGEELARFTIDGIEDLKPGEIDRESLYKYINTHVRGDRILYETPQSDLEITAHVQYVKFAEDKPLALAALDR